MRYYINQINARSFHRFSNAGSKKDENVCITLTMPENVWQLFRSYLNLDPNGKPCPTEPIPKPTTDYAGKAGCGRQGCKTALPQGVAVNGPCTCGIPAPSNLIWEQKIRKEKEK